MTTPLVCIAQKDEANYPTHDFNPGEKYPEYPFGDTEINDHGNDAYSLVRTCLAEMKLDVEHYGKPDWNPLGKYIKPGDFVIVKPNLVMHMNENRQVAVDGFECLITHPSCIRAVCDYCIIALKGTGRLMIGDAPMQGCDFNELLRKSELPRVIDFYRAYGLEVEIEDFRQYQSKFNRQKVIVEKRYNPTNGIVVHMKKRSQHYGTKSNGNYQVSDYDKAETAAFHHGATHDYEIIKEILDADVVINFCKPKTHRLAGITSAMKNIVGITYNKACLPHRTAGSVAERGDAYLNKNFLKRIADDALTRKIRAENSGRYAYATLWRWVYGATLITARTFGKDPYYIGSWYGNDTIWRTICDLNYIVQYADKNGVLKNDPQRVILHFGDMIIAGEGNGPVSSVPKKLGIMLLSEDGSAFDATVCKIMGFDNQKIPALREIVRGKTWITYHEPKILSNHMDWCEKLNTVCFPEEWKFKAHDAWKNMLG